MNLKNRKMTVQEILKVVEELGISVEDFGYGEFGVPNDFELPEELNSQRKARQEYYEIDYQKRNNQKIPEYDYKAANKYWLDKIGIGSWKEVEQDGGEDQGSNWYSIKYFEDHDVYIKTQGYYQSYSGTDFHDGYGHEVKPQEKTITVYL